MRIRTVSMMIAAATGMGLAAASAMADFSFPAFNPSPSHFVTTWQNQNLITLATPTAGVYGSYTVLVDWTGGGINDQWSSEARVFFSSTAGTGSGTSPTVSGISHSSSAQQASNGANTGNNVTNLSFSSAFGTNYNGGDPLFLDFRQTFSGANANWANVRITLNTYVPPTPPAGAIDLGNLSVGGMLMANTPYVSNTVQWYKVNVPIAIPGGDLFRANTFGNTLIGGQFGAGDTEIALYNSAGTVIGNNDDAFGTLSSDIQVNGLAAGIYYIAASAYNLNPSNGFVATATDAVPTGGVITGNIKLTITPAPGAVALLGLGGLVAGRRRRN